MSMYYELENTIYNCTIYRSFLKAQIVMYFHLALVIQYLKKTIDTLDT